MCAATANTIRCADQRCTLRTYCPKGTSFWMVWMLAYAFAGEGT